MLGVIFACPSCSASHFKPDAEAKAGVTVTCRRCKTNFRVTAAGVEALPVEAQAPISVPAPAPVPTPAQVSAPVTAEPVEARVGAHDVHAEVPAEVPNDASGGGLAELLEPEFIDEALAVDADAPVDVDALADSAVSAPIAVGAPIATGTPIDAGTPIATGMPIATGAPIATDAPELARGYSPEEAAEPAPSTEYIESAEANLQSGLDVPESPPEPAPVAQQQRSNAESESGAGSFEPSAQPAAREYKRPSSDRVPEFPSGALRAYMRDLGRYFASGSPVRKLLILTALALPLAVFVVLLISLNKPKPLHSQWVTAPAAMWSGPAAQRGYAQVDTLVRGEQVIALGKMWGEYTLVRDIWGRVGYVNRDSLTDERPSVTPESAFPGCRQAPIETDKEPCEGRARSLHDACAATCASDGRCLQRCQDRFSECIDGCKSRLTVPAPPVAAAPEPAPPAGPVETEVAAEPSDVADAKAVAAEKRLRAEHAGKPSRPSKKAPSKRTLQESPLKRR